MIQRYKSLVVPSTQIKAHSISTVGVLLVILTSSIDILVFYNSIYMQFIYKLIFMFSLFTN